MRKNHKSISLVVGLFIFLCIHTPHALAESGSPVKVVKDFARAYFMLDNSMAEYLSKDARTNENEVDMVDHYLEIRFVEACNLGYKIGYLQMLPINMKTKVLNMDDSSANIQFSATTIRSINPLFRIIGFVYGLLEEYEVQDVITVVKEDGKWKIGPGAFDMPI